MSAPDRALVAMACAWALLGFAAFTVVAHHARWGEIP